jgi:triosephosphate isomerase
LPGNEPLTKAEAVLNSPHFPLLETTLSGPRPLIAGNWKMNAGDAAGIALARAVIEGAGSETLGCDLLLCPPAVILAEVARLAGGSAAAVGGQDCHAEDAGAHTGDLSAIMLREAGASFVIVGHSERRAGHGETDAMVRAKAEAAHRAGLTAIVCIGETEGERAAGKTLDVLAHQVGSSVPAGAGAADTVIAYEPVWAIGSGRTPSPGEVAEAHAHIRARLAGRVDSAAEVRILYGGSVKPDNAGAILALGDVNGALIGGASLDAAAFLAIARLCR